MTTWAPQMVAIDDLIASSVSAPLAAHTGRS